MAGWLESLLATLAILAGFAMARRLSARLGHPPWASPVLLTALGAAAVLTLAGLPLARFEAATMPLRWLLAPALVALASVTFGKSGRTSAAAGIAANRGAALFAVTGGTVIGIGSAIGLARAVGLDATLVAALSTKTVTTPFAVAIMARVGGPVALAAALAVLTGVVGTLLVPPLLDRLRITDDIARGLALGVSAHIVATDWLTRRNPDSGGVAALAFVLAGIIASLLVPLLWGRL